MSFISVPNLREIKTQEGYFMQLVILCEGEEEKCEENQAIFSNKYLKNC